MIPYGIKMSGPGLLTGCMVILSLAIVCYAEPQQITKECKKINQCQCEIEGEGIIDLAPLDSGTKDEPAFKDIPAFNTTDRYSWNPCTPFCEVHCEGAAERSRIHNSLYSSRCEPVRSVKVVKTSNGSSNEIGLAYTQTFFPGNGGIGPYNDTSLFIWYSSSLGKSYSYVKLYCDDVDPIFKVWGSETGFIDKYYFSLTSRHCCPKRPEPERKDIIIIVIGTVAALIPMAFITSTAIRAYQGYTGWSAIPLCGVCQVVSTEDKLYYTSGKHEDTSFITNYTDQYYNHTGLAVKYSYYQDFNYRHSVIFLWCDEDAGEENNKTKITAYGEFFGHATLNYYFNLTSKYACPNVSEPTTNIPSVSNECHPFTTSTKVSTSTRKPVQSSTTHGSVPKPPPLFFLSTANLIILFILVLATIITIYCLCGLTVNSLRGKRGTDVIPNYDCWRAMLKYIMCCNNRCSCCQQRKRLEPFSIRSGSFDNEEFYADD